MCAPVPAARVRRVGGAERPKSQRRPPIGTCIELEARRRVADRNQRGERDERKHGQRKGRLALGIHASGVPCKGQLTAMRSCKCP